MEKKKLVLEGRHRVCVPLTDDIKNRGIPVSFFPPSFNSCRGRLPAPAASATVNRGWAEQTEESSWAASGASEQSPGGDLLFAELHGPESLPLSESPHRAAGQSQPSHRHREGGIESDLLFYHSLLNFSFIIPFLYLSVWCRLTFLLLLVVVKRQSRLLKWKVDLHSCNRSFMVVYVSSLSKVL